MHWVPAKKILERETVSVAVLPDADSFNEAERADLLGQVIAIDVDVSRLGVATQAVHKMSVAAYHLLQQLNERMPRLHGQCRHLARLRIGRLGRRVEAL